MGRPTIKTPKLTIKQAKFVKAKAEGKTGVEAAMIAYDTDSYSVANAIAGENLRKPSIREALHAELSRQGITIEKIVKPVVNALNNENIEIQLKGHDRAIKLLGVDKQEGGTTNYNFINVANTDRDEFGL